MFKTNVTKYWLKLYTSIKRVDVTKPCQVSVYRVERGEKRFGKVGKFKEKPDKSEKKSNA